MDLDKAVDTFTKISLSHIRNLVFLEDIISENEWVVLFFFFFDLSACFTFTKVFYKSKNHYPLNKSLLVICSFTLGIRLRPSN